MLSRRQFLAALGASTLGWPLQVLAGGWILAPLRSH